MIQNVSEFFLRKSSAEAELLQPRRAEFKDPDLEGAYRQSRLGDHLQQMRIFMIIGVVATVYFIPSDILFYGWRDRAKWLLSVRASYTLISIAFLIYSFRLPADRLSIVAILWFSASMLSQVIIATNRPQLHMGNFVVELIAILLIYLLLPVTVRRRFYAAGLLTLFWSFTLFFGREQQPQEMVRALAFAAILANFTGIVVSYRHERLDRLKYYLLRSERAARAELAEAVTERKKDEAVTQIRLDMLEYAANHTLDELLTWSLDEAGKILNSPIGFYHFVEADQTTLTLQRWSTETLKNFCRAEGAGHHYSIDKAGVWVDCVKTLAPVVHNDYESLPHKKGLPPGHAQVIREMVVPVIRKGKFVAILGVGNKPVDYTENDVEILSKLADYTWEVIGRKRAEIELQSTKDLLARTNQVARIGGWEVDLIQQKVSWTDITREIHEVDADFVPDMDTDIQFYKEGKSRETIQSLVNHAIETGEGYDVELQIITAKGNELWVHSIGHAEFEGDKVVRLYGTLQDITERKKLERLKEDVDRITRHDMKSPLNGILGIPQILMDEPNITSDQREYLQMIMDSGHSILNMIHLSLTIYQIEQGTYEFSQEYFDLLKVINKCMGDCQTLASYKNINFIISTNGLEETNPENITIAGEELLAYSVISNLMKNAVEASPKDRPIHIDITNYNTDIMFSVQNQGVVPKRIRDSFFDKYATSGKKGGTGIGTYSAKLLAEAQGWSIGMQTSEEKGTKITVTIPKTE